jgi:hypothetical protein
MKEKKFDLINHITQGKKMSIYAIIFSLVLVSGIVAIKHFKMYHPATEIDKRIKAKKAAEKALKKARRRLWTPKYKLQLKKLFRT